MCAAKTSPSASNTHSATAATTTAAAAPLSHAIQLATQHTVSSGFATRGTQSNTGSPPQQGNAHGLATAVRQPRSHTRSAHDAPNGTPGAPPAYDDASLFSTVSGPPPLPSP